MADGYVTGGWAKLDAANALELASVIATFPRAKVEKYAGMLLVLYSCMDSSGAIMAGRKTVARLAGVSEQSAQRFMDMLEADGTITCEPGANGKRATRRWSWAPDRNRQGNRSGIAHKTRSIFRSGGDRNHRQNRSGGVIEITGEIDHLQSTEYSEASSSTSLTHDHGVGLGASAADEMESRRSSGFYDDPWLVSAGGD